MNSLEEHFLSDEQVADIVQDISDRIKFPIMGAGGGFAPIGTIAYFDGTSAPQGWLLCNGQTLNITDYPELAAYFASHHGSSNYYGGNGTTTFGVPLQKGMPNNEDANKSTSEHIVGVWTDGKPLYEKTIDCGTQPNSSTKTIAHGISNIDFIVDISGIMYRSDTNIQRAFPQVNTTNLTSQKDLYADKTNVYILTATTGSAFNKNYVTLRYTKTTDSAVSAGHSADGNGVFCIKATVAGDPNGHVYSTEEHVVGQWIDGKVLYEKVVSLGALPNATEKSVNANISNLYQVVKLEAYAIDASKNTLSIPYALSTTATSNQVQLMFKNPNIYIKTGYNWSSYTGYAILQYTKTS